MSTTARLVLLYYVSRDRRYVKSVFVELSSLFRWLHAFAACAVYDSNFPVQGTIRLVELEDFGIAHISDQIL